MKREGLPHSDISGSTPACGSPKLIAACHVLHRRSKPRHPPSALSSLTTENFLGETFDVVKEPRPPSWASRSGWRASRNWCTAQIGGPERDRTADLLNANQALSQLSYRPVAGHTITALGSGLVVRRQRTKLFAMVPRPAYLKPAGLGIISPAPSCG